MITERCWIKQDVGEWRMLDKGECSKRMLEENGVGGNWRTMLEEDVRGGWCRRMLEDNVGG